MLGEIADAKVVEGVANRVGKYQVRGIAIPSEILDSYKSFRNATYVAKV